MNDRLAFKALLLVFMLIPTGVLSRMECGAVSNEPEVSIPEFGAAIDSVGRIARSLPIEKDSVGMAATDSVVSSGKRSGGLGELGSRITPVESDDNKPPQPTLHYYDKHGNPLKDPVLFLAELDTVTKVKSGPVYPLLNSVSVGVNFFDAIMLACGQKHAGFDLWADLSLFNWIFPVVELGAGYADNRPEDGNYHYKSPLSLYGKLGFNYNFLYKSNPDYQAFIGFRAGYTHFTYDVTDVTVNSSYWQQSRDFDLIGQKADVFYGEALAGVKVKLVRNLSMGWNIRLHFKFHSSGSSPSRPWYIPGYGTSGLIGATFSLIYTLPLQRRQTVEEP